jgi:hypothetical protein
VIIAPYVRWNINGWLQRGSKVVGVLCVAWGVLIGLLFFVFSGQKTESEEWGSGRLERGIRSAYEAIGGGALSLNPANQAAFLNFHQEILVLAKNTRPDAPISRSGKIRLGLKSSGEEQVVTSGSCIYLRYDAADSGALFHFSEEPTSLWMKPTIMDQSGVFIEVGRKISSGEEEVSRFSLPEPMIAEVQGLAGLGGKGQGMEELKAAQVWSRDVLLESYGGAAYTAMKEKLRITFGTASAACYVSAGDYLTFKEGAWKVVSLQDVQPDAPLLYIKALFAKGVEIFAWDATGFYPFHLTLELQHPAKLISRSEALPSSLHIRTPSQITCLLGKRRLILKRGDWLLKTSSGWRNLKRAQDLEDCLTHRLRGELFICDSIEKDALKGSLFDEMRTQMQPVTIPIEQEKKPSKKPKPHKKSSL